MSHADALKQLASECPRKILDVLHAKGRHVHGTCARFPGKVLCIQKDSPLPDDWVPTPAQVALTQAEQQQQLPAAHG